VQKCGEVGLKCKDWPENKSVNTTLAAFQASKYLLTSEQMWNCSAVVNVTSLGSSQMSVHNK